MNYRHIFHAGNFADVLKHAVLARVLTHLKMKDTPFRVIDTHAGTGVYDLASVEAGKTGEWLGGIGRLNGPDAEALPAGAAEVLEPLLAVIRAMPPSAYPGSPEIARRMLRHGDALVLNELHPADHAELRERYAPYAQIKVLDLDAWTALKALLPPPEKRGLVLIDPPFEAPDEMARLARGLAEALKRFAHGTYLIWYPIKDMPPVEAFHASLAPLGIAKSLRIEHYTRAPDTPHRLNGCGLLAINPPWTLRKDMQVLLPFLANRFSNGPGSGWSLTG